VRSDPVKNDSTNPQTPGAAQLWKKTDCAERAVGALSAAATAVLRSADRNVRRLIGRPPNKERWDNRETSA
jgi:hypothetical protein